MILEGIVTTLVRTTCSTSHRWAPRSMRARSMHRFVLRPYRTSTTYAQPQGARRGRVSRHRRRAAAGPGGDRRAARAASRPSADERGGRRDPGRRLPVLRVPGRSSSTTATIAPGSWSRPSPRDASATSSGSTGPSTPWSRRRSWRRGRPGCRSAISCSNSASSRCWSRRRAAPPSRPHSRFSMSSCARPPSSRAFDPDLRPSPP